MMKTTSNVLAVAARQTEGVRRVINNLTIGSKEADRMNETTQRAGDYRFILGLFTGTCFGAGLAMWLAPGAVSGVRDRVTRLVDSARSVRHEASDKYQRASTRLGEMVDDVTQRGRDVCDDIAGAVARGAHEVAHGALEVERVATAATRRRVADAKPSV